MFYIYTLLRSGLIVKPRRLLSHVILLVDDAEAPDVAAFTVIPVRGAGRDAAAMVEPVVPCAWVVALAVEMRSSILYAAEVPMILLTRRSCPRAAMHAEDHRTDVQALALDMPIGRVAVIPVACHPEAKKT